MKVIRSAEVQCDDCGKILRRLAPPHLPVTRMAERRLTRRISVLAVARGWQVEGPSVMAGDLCRGCARIASGVGLDFAPIEGEAS